MFKLESVLLLALDVVKGPYVHCCVPEQNNADGQIAKLLRELTGGASNRNTNEEETVSTPTAAGTSTLSSPTAANATSPNSRNGGNFTSSKFTTTHTSSNTRSPMVPPNPNAFNSDGASSSSLRNTSQSESSSGNLLSGKFNNVLVPRGEFCRRVLWLHSAETGALFLYYPEDIAGEQYLRKNLRYSVCLVFQLSKTMMTPGEEFIREFVQPYITLLTVVAEELRSAEEQYNYVSDQLYNSNSVLSSGGSNANAIQAKDLIFNGFESSTTENTTGTAAQDRSGANKNLDVRTNGGAGKNVSKHLNYFVTSAKAPEWTSLSKFLRELYEGILNSDAASAGAANETNNEGNYRNRSQNSNNNRPFQLCLSDTIKFHLKCMAPLQPLTEVYLDSVPVAITTKNYKNLIFLNEDEENPMAKKDTADESSNKEAAYNAGVDSYGNSNNNTTYVLDSMDIVMQAILKLIHKNRTVADICFALALHTTVTLDDIYRAAAEFYASAHSYSNTTLNTSINHTSNSNENQSSFLTSPAHKFSSVIGNNSITSPKSDINNVSHVAAQSGTTSSAIGIAPKIAGSAINDGTKLTVKVNGDVGASVTQRQQSFPPTPHMQLGTPTSAFSLAAGTSSSVNFHNYQQFHPPRHPGSPSTNMNPSNSNDSGFCSWIDVQLCPLSHTSFLNFSTNQIRANNNNNMSHIKNLRGRGTLLKKADTDKGDQSNTVSDENAPHVRVQLTSERGIVTFVLVNCPAEGRHKGDVANNNSVGAQDHANYHLHTPLQTSPSHFVGSTTSSTTGNNSIMETCSSVSHSRQYTSIACLTSTAAAVSGVHGDGAAETDMEQAVITIPADFKVELELPALWADLVHTVSEAVQHLAMSQLIRLFPHRNKIHFFSNQSKYSVTATFKDAILTQSKHPARRALGEYMYQQCQKEMHRQRHRHRKGSHGAETSDPSHIVTLRLVDKRKDNYNNIIEDIYEIRESQEDLNFCLHYKDISIADCDHVTAAGEEHSSRYPLMSTAAPQKLLLYSNRLNEDALLREKKMTILCTNSSRRNSHVDSSNAHPYYNPNGDTNVSVNITYPRSQTMNWFSSAVTDSEEDEDEYDSDDSNEVEQTGAKQERKELKETDFSLITPSSYSRTEGEISSHLPEKRHGTPNMKAHRNTMREEEDQINIATSAALCALTKFTNSSLVAVQAAMRQIPHHALSQQFMHWSNHMCLVLLEIALLNRWLEEAEEDRP